MKNLNLKLSAISFTMLALSGCASNNDPLFPTINETTSSAAVYNMRSELPVLGNTNFEPVKIKPGSTTGTFVSEKVSSFRTELVSLQNSIRKHNTDLQKLRTSVTKEATEYASSISAIETKLQMGTTPGNPHVVASLQGAQNNIKNLTGSSILTNQLTTRIIADATTTSYVLNSIKTTYSVSGAVDEDHAELKILQSEAEETSIILNNMLNEARTDYANQLQYIDNANKTVNSLEEPVRRGRLGGVAATPMFAPTPTVSPTQMPTTSAGVGFSNRPLVVVKSDSINYKQGLKQAVNAALQTKSDMVFDVVSVTPAKASKDIRNKTRNKASEVFQEMVLIGVNPENVGLSAKSYTDSKSPEVHIYVK